MRLFEDLWYWVKVSSTDHRALEIFKRHYSCKNKGYRQAGRFVGPGEQIVLLGIDGKALFVWRKEVYRQDGQTGINCSVFRNEGGKLVASQMIIEAVTIANDRWPGERLFTFVDTKEVLSKNPGYCYKCAGWSQCGQTKKGLLIFEKTFPT